MPSELPADLLNARLVWVWCGGMVPHLHPLYDGPYALLHWGPCAFTLHVGQQEVIVVSCLKACTAVDATPGSPRRCIRTPGPRRNGHAARHPPPAQVVQLLPSRCCFQTHWFLHHHSRSSRESAREPFFSYPTGRFCTPRASSSFASSTKAVPAASALTPMRIDL